MNSRLLLPLILFAATFCTGCVGPLFTPKADTDPTVKIYLVKLGWHTDLVIPLSQVPADFLPERRDFAQADYVSIGWGDYDYYRDPDAGAWTTMKAGLFPTASVLHVFGFEGTVVRRYPDNEILELHPSRSAFTNLCRYVEDSFKRNGTHAIPIPTPEIPHSLFYPARGRFHLFRTCNTWTASALRTAGCPIGHFSALFSETLITEVRRCQVRMNEP